MAGFECREVRCESWNDLVTTLDQFNEPRVIHTWDGDVITQGWIFRGHSSTAFELEPSVERLAKQTAGSIDWTLVEENALATFASKAPLHLEQEVLPQLQDRLLLCSLARHYGVPTRLLDFTYSPFLAVYFALRERLRLPQDDASEACVWVVNLNALMIGAEGVFRVATAQDDAESTSPPRRVSLNPIHFHAQLDRARMHESFWEQATVSAMNPTPAKRYVYNNRGFVVPYLPRQHNPRLSCQQGLFLLSGATEKTFAESLRDMMSRVNEDWCRRIIIARGLELTALRQLFRMNIHDLSVYPDSYGLAQFVTLQSILRFEQAPEIEYSE